MVNEEDVAQLMNMGFPESRCRKALVQTGNLGPDMALNWLFEHADDMEDIPMPSADSHIDVSSLVDMGFTERHAREAMKQTVT